MTFRLPILWFCLSIASLGQPIAVKHLEGSTHVFLVLRDPASGEPIASGDLLEIVRGDIVKVHTEFRFKDGSLDNEETVFSQNKTFKLISNHRVQKGPSFPDRMNVSINAKSGQVTWCECKMGREEMKTEHVDLPADLSNGVVFSTIKNISPKAQETDLSYLVVVSKPRVIKLVIRPESEDHFSIAGQRYSCTRLGVHPEIGGLLGVVAPIIGKQPPEAQVWIAYGLVPAFMKFQGASYIGGPLWTMEVANAVW